MSTEGFPFNHAICIYKYLNRSLAILNMTVTISYKSSYGGNKDKEESNNLFILSIYYVGRIQCNRLLDDIKCKTYLSISTAFPYPMRYQLSVCMSVCCQNLKGY